MKYPDKKLKSQWKHTDRKEGGWKADIVQERDALKIIHDRLRYFLNF